MARVSHQPPPSSSVNTGASILCYTISPQWGQPYFLLGKERYNAHWPAGSGKWSDFGGSRSNTDRDPEDTAAREFLEETCASVRYFDDDILPRTSYTDIADSLRQQLYTMKLYISYRSVAENHFVVFVKQVPWDPECVFRFTRTRDMLQHAHAHYGTYEWRRDMHNHPAVTITPANVVNVNRDYMEKMELWLWGLDQLHSAASHTANAALRPGEQCRASFIDFLHIFLQEFP